MKVFFCPAHLNISSVQAHSHVKLLEVEIKFYIWQHLLWLYTQKVYSAISVLIRPSAIIRLTFPCDFLEPLILPSIVYRTVLHFGWFVLYWSYDIILVRITETQTNSVNMLQPTFPWWAIRKLLNYEEGRSLEKTKHQCLPESCNLCFLSRTTPGTPKLKCYCNVGVFGGNKCSRCSGYLWKGEQRTPLVMHLLADLQVME